MNILNWQLFLEKVGESPIVNIDEYINGMSKGIEDKLFFLNKIDFDCIVDFGCANGLLLKKISEHKPSIRIIGYDLDKDMIEKSKKNNPNGLFTDKWDEVVLEIKKYRNPVLNLSSVIHEVYSYSNTKEISKFWKEKVFSGMFKYITIRDMIPSSKIEKEYTLNFIDDVDKVRNNIDEYYLKSFEDRWGRIDKNYRTFIHFLLKYKYINNWKRENNENYLPISIETIKKKITNNYHIKYEDSFVLDYLKREVKKDFDIDINHTTHTKLIIERQ